MLYWKSYKTSLWLRDLQCVKLTKDKKTLPFRRKSTAHAPAAPN